MKKSILLIFLTCIASSSITLSAMEGKHASDETVESPLKKQKTALPQKTNEVANPDLGYLSRFPKELLKEIVRYLIDDSNTLSKALKNAACLSGVNKYFYAHITEEKKGLLRTRVLQALNQYPSSGQLTVYNNDALSIAQDKAAYAHDKKVFQMLSWLGILDEPGSRLSPAQLMSAAIETGRKAVKEHDEDINAILRLSLAHEGQYNTGSRGSALFIRALFISMVIFGAHKTAKTMLDTMGCENILNALNDPLLNRLYSRETILAFIRENCDHCSKNTEKLTINNQMELS